MKISNTICTMVLLLLASSCKVKSVEISEMTTPTVSSLPSAIIYRTNINVNDKVPVTVTPDGARLVSFPAPSDIGPSFTPIVLADGWLLDRRGGIGLNTRFLSFTYDEYARLKEVPSIAALLEHIIPTARVTDTYQLNQTLQEALSDTASINNEIRSGRIKTNSILLIK